MIGKIKMEIKYFQSPNRIFEVDGLTEHELIVYLYLCRCGNQGSKIFPSYADIGYKTNTSEATAKRAITGLINKELIIKHNTYKKSKNGKISRSSNVYEICTDIDEYLKKYKAKEDKSEVLSEGEVILPLGQTELRGKVRETQGLGQTELRGKVRETQGLGQTDPIKRTTEKELYKKELYNNNEIEHEDEQQEEKSVVVVDNLIDKFKQKYSGNLDDTLLKKLIANKTVDIVDKCIDEFENYVNNADQVEKVFYDFCVKWGTDKAYKKNTKYENKNNNNSTNFNNKPIQSTNYKQREYDDEFFDSLYDNIHFIK